MNKEIISIGNLVKYKSEVREIDGIFLSIHNQKDYTVSFKDIDDLVYLDEIEPIPFDESYLERLNFVHESVWANKGLSFHEGVFFLSSVCIGKLYVHQVQNLLNILIHQP